MAIPRPVDPRNHYWIVGGSTTQVYSSAVGDFVPVTDAAYQAWLSASNLPTRIDTEANLGGVLAPYFQRPADTAAGVLDGYKEAQATKLTVEIAAKILFNHENRIRTLEGQPTVTAAQFRAFIKGMM